MIYLSLISGYAGKDNMEQALVDQVVDTVSDVMDPFYKFKFESDEAKNVIHNLISFGARINEKANCVSIMRLCKICTLKMGNVIKKQRRKESGN